jgi:hypothetical protein
LHIGNALAVLAARAMVSAARVRCILKLL